MEFGYEERSRRLIERLDRIQNYLQSLPPLPKISTAESREHQIQDEVEVQSTECQTEDESNESVGSLTTGISVSTKPSRTIPKTDCASNLLQQSLGASPDGSITIVTVSSSTAELGKTKKKKRARSNKVHDPLKPTTRTSFGVDIGQGINVINYIKQNAMPASEARKKRLAGIITKDTDPSLHTPQSMERIYKQGPLTADTSSMSIQLKTAREAEIKQAGGKHKQPFAGPSGTHGSFGHPADSDIYRVRYQERAVELPHHHGLDALQELFVPYVEHDPPPEIGSRNPSRNHQSTSDYE